MDTATMEKAGAKPIKPALDAIAAAKTTDDIVKLFGSRAPRPAPERRRGGGGGASCDGDGRQAGHVLRRVAEGVLVHESEFLQSNTVVVEGKAGVLLIDPGIRRAEMDCISNDLRELGESVAAGFSTHPHWDHVLWDASLGDAPRYGTARCSSAIGDVLADPVWKDRVAEELPPEIAGDVPLDLFGLLKPLPAGAADVPWDGPRVRVVEHRGHAPGHAALVIEERGVLVAGDMLSDVLIPMLDPRRPGQVDAYAAALDRLAEAARDVDVVVPGHGAVARGHEVAARLAADRAYIDALRRGKEPVDARLGQDWLSGPHQANLEQARRSSG